MRWFASLRRTGEFARVRRRGRRAALGTLAVYGLERAGSTPRVGITVGRAVGAAVVRNRVRRRVQGALQALVRPDGRAPVAGDVVIVARPQAAAAPYTRLAADVAAGLARIGSRR